MDVQTLGQAFLDWTRKETPEEYDGYDDAEDNVYTSDYGDNVSWGAVEELFWSYRDPKVEKEVGGSKVTLQEQHGGEGEGDEYWLVFRVENSDGSEQFFRVDGYYASYDGTSWDGAQLREVNAVPRTVVFYE
jgi:hypothetical protein